MIVEFESEGQSDGFFAFGSTMAVCIIWISKKKNGPVVLAIE
jgi:hypothetical protein